MGLGPFTEGYIQGAIIGELLEDTAGFLGERRGRKLARRAADHLPPEGWHADPVEQYEFRYWDDAEWTGYVSSPSAAQFDPL